MVVESAACADIVAGAAGRAMPSATSSPPRSWNTASATSPTTASAQSAMTSLDSTGFCWNVSWNVRWLGSSRGGAWPGAGRSAPNGRSWHEAVMVRLTVDPRRNGWRPRALTSVSTCAPGGTDTISSRTVKRTVPAGSWAVTNRRAGALPWFENDSRYDADQRPAAVVASAHAWRPAAPLSSRRPSATADDVDPTSDTARTANGSVPVGVDAPTGGRNVTVISASFPGSTDTLAGSI